MSDDLATELMLEHQGYMRALVHDIHKKLPSHVDFEELVGYGQLGLAEAARSFDPARCVSFETYSYYRIRGAVFDGIRESTWLPPSLRRTMSAESGANEVARANAESPSDASTREECAERFRTVVQKLGAVFLTAGALEQSDSAKQASDVAHRADLPELGRRVTRAVEALSEQSRDVIRMHYFEHKTFTHIGRVLGVHKSTVMRWHDSAIEDLQRSLGELQPAKPPRTARATG